MKIPLTVIPDNWQPNENVFNTSRDIVMNIVYKTPKWIKCSFETFVKTITSKDFQLVSLKSVVAPLGFEPRTYRLSSECSSQLSYGATIRLFTSKSNVGGLTDSTVSSS